MNKTTAAANVTKGYVGGMEVDIVPITKSYYQAGLCPVNVHWHLGSEHFSAGEFDCEDPKKCGPYHAADDAAHDDDGHTDDAGEGDSRRQLAGDARKGYQCNYYDEDDSKFTAPYDWQFCDKTMEVGQTYEIHWPHSSAGACGTPNQYQTPFYDGVFCNLPLDVFQTLSAQDIASNVGVQAQVFTIVNDEAYYYPNLFGVSYIVINIIISLCHSLSFRYARTYIYPNKYSILLSHQSIHFFFHFCLTIYISLSRV